jgi:hypothetical protein
VKATTDPIVEAFLSITRRYRAVILASMLIAAAGGGVIGGVVKRGYESMVVFSAGVVDPDGPIVDLQTADVQVEGHVERMIVGGQLSDETEVDAAAIRDQYPSSKKLPILMLKASSPDAASVRRAMERGAGHMRSLEQPIYEFERRRLEESLKELDREVRRLSDGPITPKTQESLLRAITDRADTKRRLSPLRTYSSEVLATLPVKQAAREPRMLAFAMLGLVGGGAGGYVIAFFLLALNRMRGLEQRRAT